jgi:hypothetical protein
LEVVERGDAFDDEPVRLVERDLALLRHAPAHHGSSAIMAAVAWSIEAISDSVWGARS